MSSKDKSDNSDEANPNKKGKKLKKEEQPKVPKKRGRKPKNMDTGVGKHKKSVITEENEQIILHLPIRTTDLDNDDGTETKNDVKESETEMKSIFEDKNITKKKNKKVVEVENEAEEETSIDSDEIDSSCQSCVKLKSKIKLLKMKQRNLSKIIAENKSYEKERKVVKLDINLIDNTTKQLKTFDKTNIACWWCTYNFDCMPFFIPDSYDANTNAYNVFGCFCSVNCALAYNVKMNDYKIWDRHNLIVMLYKTIFGKEEKVELSPAPPKECLERYGGYMTIEKFRENSINLTKEYRLLIPPMSSIMSYIEEDYRSKTIL